MPIKCKYCKYYGEPRIRGHGENWGTCTYIDKLKEEIQTNRNQTNEDDILISIDPYQYIRNKEDNCLFIRIMFERKY